MTTDMDNAISHDLVCQTLTENAIGVLLGIGYESFCRGSDELESAGLWDAEGQESEAGRATRLYFEADRKRNG